MRKLLFIAGSALALSSCVSTTAQPNPSYVPASLSPSMTEKLKQGVAKTLKDPESARFGDKFSASDDGQRLHVCGYVNAKNSYGGYVGMSPFIAEIDKKTQEVVDSSADASEVGANFIRETCAKAGAPLG